MSLLSVTVKKARFVGEQAHQFNSYVTLKLQNVKSTTVTVKGANPCWEQDFLFETNDVNTGLLVEVWNKGMLWDNAVGYHYIPLPEVSYSNEVTTNQKRALRERQALDQQQQQQQQPTLSLPMSDMTCDNNSNTCQQETPDTDGSGQWMGLDLGLEMRGGEVVGTKLPTGHTLLIDCRFELPFDPENTEAADLQRKLEMLNNTMDQEARAEQARRQILYNIGHSGYSEDSDYTSDLNYPVGGQGANSSASQFRSAANQLATPQRSLETSRENSYERDDHQIPSTVGGRLTAGNYGGYGGRGASPRYEEPYPEEGPPQKHSIQQSAELSEPLFYNSRPRHYKEHRRQKHKWDHEDSKDTWYSDGYEYQTTRVDLDSRIFSDTEYYPGTTASSTSRRKGPHRRPSLERQTTLYDEHPHYAIDGYGTDSRIVGKMSATYPESQTDIRYYDSITGYVYQDERYGQDDEDRQWDSGGKWYLGARTYYENKRNKKTLPERPASSIGIHRPEYKAPIVRQSSYDSEEVDYSGAASRRRKALHHQHRPTSRQEGTGKKLPPTPTKPSSVIFGRKPASLPATPGRQLPRTRTPSEESYSKSEYNEDYNYAYHSQDNLPQDTYQDNVYSQAYDQPIVKDTYPSSLQDPYTVPYQESMYKVETTLDHSYTRGDDDYSQAPYDQSQAYIQNTYPSQYHQQSFDQPEQESYQMVQEEYGEIKDAYDKPTEVMDNYREDSYDQNNTQYSQPYEQDYQGQYMNTEYTVPVSSIYDQDNITSEYNQYPQEQHDDQYNVATSTAYRDTYGDSYDQAPVTDSHANYREPYVKRQESFQEEDYGEYRQQYDQEKNADFKESYKDDYQYQEDYNAMQYEDSYQDTSEQGSYDNRYPDNQQQDRRKSEVPELSVTTPRGQTKINGYRSSESEYFYPSQENQEVSPLGLSKRKKLGKKDASPLLQQNTDSLESRDDELKDSFETAVNSMGSSQPGKGFSEYSTADESSPAAATLVDSPQSAAQDQAAMANHVNTNHVNANVTTTTAIMHSTVANNGKRLIRTDSYSKNDLDDEEYPEIVPSEPRRKDSQLSHQSQMSQHSTHSQKPKLIRGDSCASDHYAEDSYGRKDSYGQSSRKDSITSITQEGYSKPTLSRTDSYQKRDFTRDDPSRGSSYATNFKAPQPISREESYQRGYFDNQNSIDETEIVLSNTVNGEYKMRDETLERYERGEEALIRGSRENSLVEPYKNTPPISRSDSPRGSVTKQASLEESVQMDTPPRSPPEPPLDEELLEMVGAAPVPTQLKERTEMTARQRWHWAYNKIVMQLNVSTNHSMTDDSVVFIQPG